MLLPPPAAQGMPPTPEASHGTPGQPFLGHDAIQTMQNVAVPPLQVRGQVAVRLHSHQHDVRRTGHSPGQRA